MNAQIQSTVQFLSAISDTTSDNIKGIAARLKKAGTNSRKAGEEKKLKALRWVYQWGWSSPVLVDKIGSPNRRGLAKNLVEKGYLNSYPNPSGGDKGSPRQAICLTERGQEFVEMRIDEAGGLLAQNREDDIPWHQLRHDFLVQQASARAIVEGKIVQVFSPKEFAHRSAEGIKEHDAIWRLSDGSRIGIELELTRKKKGRDENQNLLSLLRSLSREKGDGKVDMIAFLSGSKGILDAFQEQLRPGHVITTYSRDQSRRWVESGSIKVPDWAKGRFMFRKIDL